ncbi:MAG: glycosyltransferase family 2 protein, partial [Pyrinomonadaceae bacterium]|nr:glycosyltransferase family 2 protein [Sphingobacteriaceae bacterium]
SNRKLNVKLVDAYVYHYGWVKPPSGLVRKGMNFNLFYHKDAVETPVAETAEFDYGNADNMKLFTETHPAVMLPRIKAVNWEYTFDPTKVKSSDSLRRRLLQKFYEWTGIRVGEYRNYRMI